MESKIYTIRREVLNITYSQWMGIGDGDLIGTAKYIYESIGYINILRSKANDEELEFVKEQQKLI